MDQGVLHLADVAVLFFVGFNKSRTRFPVIDLVIDFVIDLVTFNKFGWKNVWRDEHGLST